MNIEKTEYESKIKILFDNWKKDKHLEYFVTDGIIDPEFYFRSKVKVLFITKEANDCDDKGGYDLCKKILNPENYKTYVRHMIQWTWAFNENFPDLNKFYEKVDEVKNKFIRSFAVLNLKKSGGGETSNNYNILEFAKRNKEFIKAELDIINPDIIIGLMSCPICGLEIINPKTRYIKFYHPSYRRYTDQVFLNKLQDLYLNNI